MPRSVCTRIRGVFALGLFILLPSPHGFAAELKLPAPLEWEPRGIERRASEHGIELRLVSMFQPAGIVAPSVAVAPGTLVTFEAAIGTSYPSSFGYYRCWLEMEFLSGGEPVGSVRSSFIQGTAPEQVLALSEIVPAGASAVRVGIWAQNRVSRVLPNAATVGAVRLRALDRPGSAGVRVEPLSALPASAGARSVRLAVLADWPDGTAVALETTRGTVTPSVLLSGGRGTVTLAFANADVGTATIAATLAGRTTRYDVRDPFAGRLTLDGVEAKGTAVPALVQLVRDGKVLPGRYQSIPGEFVHAPWSLEVTPGHYLIRVSRGPQCDAIERAVDVASGRDVSLGRITLPRAVDLGALGWYGGDPDGDVYHGQRIYTDVSAETAGRVARAVGLDWVTPANWGQPAPKTWGEARSAMDGLSTKDLLFRFADEKKWLTGHFCFVGLDRPGDEPFDAYWNQINRLNPTEALRALRDTGAATFANHPVRYWMSGVNNETFVTNMFADMPFSLCAAGLLDGINVNEGGDAALRLWSLLLDHGYRVTATAGADFSLDHPGGWLPGLSRLYVHAPGGLTERAIVDAIKGGRTIVSTGPLLVASLDEALPPGTVAAGGRTHRITARGWARRDRTDRLRRIELFAHGQACQSRVLDDAEAEAQFDWTPAGAHDWVAVRLVADSGWALTSAFYAAEPGWQPPAPVTAQVAVRVTGLESRQTAGALLEVWDNRPDAPGAAVVDRKSLGPDGRIETDAPVTATVRLVLPDGRRRDVRLYDASGVAAITDTIARGAEKDAPLLRWETYADVLRRCQTIDVTFDF